MKKRILAVFLAFCVFAGAFSVSKRVHAAGVAAVSAVVSIGLIAWELLDLMIKGEEPGIVVAMRELIESGVDGLTNPDSYFQQTYGDFWKDYGPGYESIYNTVLEMYENGEITISNGKVDLTYSQYKELFDIAYSYVPNIGVDIKTPYSYFAFDYVLGTTLPVLSLPVNDLYYRTAGGQSYALMFYSDSKVVFSNIYFSFREIDFRYDGSANRLDAVFSSSGTGWFFNNFDEYELDHYNWRFLYSSLSSFKGLWYSDRSVSTDSCFVFENGNLSFKNISSVDVSGFKCAIISTIGDFGEFLQSITSAAVTDTLASELDDLSSVLPVEENPVLTIPISPDLSLPIADQVTVSIPGATDVPISEYFDPVLTDIKAPTGLASKFPFCIPFDFVRILSVLAADPIPPVFRIPLSTHPKNLEAFADNETIGDYVAPENPMFDIDEEIVIDFAHIPLVQPVCYTIFLVGFVIMLIKLTPKLIQH